MKISTYLESLDQIDDCLDANVSEVILGANLFSRFGKLSVKDVNNIAKEAKARGLRVVFEWDVLMTSPRFELAKKVLKDIDFSLISAIRVQDPGAINYVLESMKDMPIQLILEQGNHNLIGIQRWCSLVGKQLERLVLSIELPKKVLSSYISALDVPIEILGLGRVLLFYTPRNLLSAQIFDHDDPEAVRVHDRPLEAIGHSEESPHSGFPLVENTHGTFMFNTKDHCLLEQIDELLEFGLDTMRIDLRFGKDFSFIKKISSLSSNFDLEIAKKLKDEYPANVIKGFYNVNKTDVLFKKLKNKRIQRKDNNYLGDVVEVMKKRHIAIMLRNKDLNIKKNDTIEIHTADGKIKTLAVNNIQSSSLKPLETASAGQVIFVSHVGGISVRAQVYLV